MYPDSLWIAGEFYFIRTDGGDFLGRCITCGRDEIILDRVQYTLVRSIWLDKLGDFKILDDGALSVHEFMIRKDSILFAVKRPDIIENNQGEQQ